MKEKVNTHFSFPLRLDMTPYTEDFLMGKNDRKEGMLYEINWISFVSFIYTPLSAYVTWVNNLWLSNSNTILTCTPEVTLFNECEENDHIFVLMCCSIWTGKLQVGKQFVAGIFWFCRVIIDLEQKANC